VTASAMQSYQVWTINELTSPMNIHVKMLELNELTSPMNIHVKMLELEVVTKITELCICRLIENLKYLTNMFLNLFVLRNYRNNRTLP
jgi:hypothetical protein